MQLSSSYFAFLHQSLSDNGLDKVLLLVQYTQLSFQLVVGLKKVLLLVDTVVLAAIHIPGLLASISLQQVVGLTTHHLELTAARIN